MIKREKQALWSFRHLRLKNRKNTSRSLWCNCNRSSCASRKGTSARQQHLLRNNEHHHTHEQSRVCDQWMINSKLQTSPPRCCRTVTESARRMLNKLYSVPEILTKCYFCWIVLIIEKPRSICKAPKLNNREGGGLLFQERTSYRRFGGRPKSQALFLQWKTLLEKRRFVTTASNGYFDFIQVSAPNRQK